MTAPDIDLRRVAKQYGTPAYIFDPTTLHEDYTAIAEAGQRFRGGLTMAYSLKTNYLPALLAVIRDLGLQVDVVSEYEYQWARRHDFDASAIIVNGPHKPDSLIRSALREGAFINVETLEEVQALGAVAATEGIQNVEMGVRVGSPVDPYTGTARVPLSKFGAPVGSSYLDLLVDAIDAEPRLRLSGIHCHLGSQITTVENYHSAIEPVLTWASQVRADHQIDRINLGGGMGVEGISRTQASWMDDPSRPSATRTAFLHRDPDLGNWFAGIDARWKREGLDSCALIIEPGRRLVSRCMTILAEVSSVKDFCGERIVTIDAGVNLLPTAGPGEAHRIEFPTSLQDNMERARIVGPLCYEGDVFSFSHDTPRVLARGDLALVRDAGAYGLTRATSFNQLRAPVIQVDRGDTSLVWRRETVEDLLRFPEEATRMDAR